MSLIGFLTLLLLHLFPADKDKFEEAERKWLKEKLIKDSNFNLTDFLKNHWTEKDKLCFLWLMRKLGALTK